MTALEPGQTTANTPNPTTPDHPQRTIATMNAVTLLNPYQAMGTEIPADMTTAQALEYTGLAGWNQRLVQPIIMDGAQEYPAGSRRMLIADLPTGPAVLGAVTTAYKPIQNEDAYAPLIDKVGEAGLRPLYAGAWDNGRATFVTFEVPDGAVSLAGDKLDTYLLATKRNDGFGLAKITPTMIRAQCANQITAVERMSRPIVTQRHSGGNPFVVQQAEILLGLTHDWAIEALEPLKALQRIKLPKQAYAKDIVPAVLGERHETHKPTQTMWDAKFEALVAAWDSPVHAGGNTAWRGYSAITEWEQHYRSTDAEVMGRATLVGEAPYARRALAVLAGASL